MHSAREEVRDREDVPDLGFGRTRHILTEDDRRFLEVGELTRKITEIVQNSTNVGGLTH